jgi:exoribonuclease-2
MLPPPLSENIASFRVGERSPALSFIARIRADGEILDYCIVRSVVRIAERLTYSDADAAIAAGSDMARLHRFSQALRERRLRAGGICFLMPELQLRVDRSRDITLKLRDRETPGQLLVSECMILANYCAARYFEESRQPGLFRRQAEPLQRLPLSKGSGLFDLIQQRRMLRRVEVSTAAGPHSSLGLPSYMSITSPLRKYLDLVMQRQLVSLLQGGQPAYTRRELSDITCALQPVLTRAALVENERWRYWLLKALKSHAVCRLEALVLDRSHEYYELLLPRFMLTVPIKTQNAGDLAPGGTIEVVLETIDPFSGSIHLRVAHRELQAQAEAPANP